MSGMLKVLDAWAMLAWLNDEQPAADKVQKMLDEAETGGLRLRMSIVNVGEVYYRLARVKGEDESRAFLKDLKRMPIRTLAVPNKLVIEAAKLKSRYSISYADAFAVATARREGAAVVTGDPELKQFISGGVIEIEWIGPSG